MPSQLGVTAMALRFERSLGVIGLVRWNLRESALMFRLGLLDVAANIGSKTLRNPVAVLDADRSRPSFFSRWLPVLTREQPAERSQILQPEKSPLSDRARVGRILLKIAFMAALFLGGYLTGRLAIPESEPTADANANQALAAPSAPEPFARLVWVSQETVLPELSSAPPPVSVVSAPKPESARKDTRPLNNDEVRETQAWLKAFGFYAGPVDGLPGRQTTAAVKRYRTARQMEETDALDRSILQQVRQQVGHSSR
jgi:hypothetical protein